MDIELGSQSIPEIQQQQIIIQKIPTLDFLKAVVIIKYRTKCMLALHLCTYLMNLIGQIRGYTYPCQYSNIQKWGLIFTCLSYTSLFYYFYYLHLIEKTQFLIQIAEEIQQLESQDQQFQVQVNISQGISNVDQIEGTIKQKILQKHKILIVAFTISILIAQASLISFFFILNSDHYKINLVPAPHFSGNCEDVLLNFGFVIFLFQIGTYGAFYVSCLVMVSFFPFIILFVIGYVTRWAIRRCRLQRRANQFPIKSYNEVQGDKECAICMQDYLPTEKLKELTCPGRHHFHQVCIDEWLRVQSVCPLCRKDFQQN